MHVPLVVLGGGPGGYAAAFLAADLGMEVAIIERDERLGGTCLLRCCIPSKALLHVGRVLAESREMAEWGIGFQRPTIDIDALRARKDKVISALTGGLATLARRRTVTLVRGDARFTGSTSLAVTEPDGSSKTITFDHCILASGSRPTRVPAFDIGSERVMDSTGALELRDIPETLLVIGGGYIGLEMGTVYAELGSQVSVVELTDALLPGADRDLVKPLQKRLEKLLTAIHLRTKVVKLADTGSAVRVEFEGPEGPFAAEFSRVLVAVASTTGSGRPIRTSSPSATCAASRCSPIGLAIRARWPSRFSTARRLCSRRGRFRPWCSLTPRSPGRASPSTRRKRSAGRSKSVATPGPPAAGPMPSAALTASRRSSSTLKPTSSWASGSSGRGQGS